MLRALILMVLTGLILFLLEGTTVLTWMIRIGGVYALLVFVVDFVSWLLHGAKGLGAD